MLYPSRWRGQFKSPDDHENWCQCWGEELDERNVTFDEVKQGLARCIEFYDWPPSFPEFMKACRPSVHAEAAFYEAIKQMQMREKGLDQWSSPIVYWAAIILGRDLMNHGYAQIRIRWECALNEASRDIKEGKRPNEVPPRLDRLPEPHKPRQKGMSEAARQEMMRIQEILELEPKWQRGNKHTGEPDLGSDQSFEKHRAA